MRPRFAPTAEVLLASGVLLSRLPFLWPGYGADPDAWRIAWAGHETARLGQHLSSRAPGNPVLECAAAALSRSPAWALNALTALLGCAAVVMFGALLRRLGCRTWLVGALALAFVPVVAIHSCDSMDYVWGLAFLLGAWHAALDRRPGFAGFLVGVAAGCRITSLVMLAPLAIVVMAASGPALGGRVRAVLALWGVGVATALAAFSPVIALAGPGFLHGYENGYPPLLYVAKNLTVDVWGVIGCLALGLAALRLLARRGRPPAEAALPAGAGAVLSAAVLAVVLELVLFLRLPHEAAYLIPAVPFTLLLAARALSRREYRILCVCILVSAFIAKVSEPGKLNSVPADATSRRVRLGGRELQVDLLRGPLVVDHLRRRTDLDYLARVRATARRQEGRSVIVAGEWLPALRVLAGGVHDGAARYVHTLTASQADSLRQEGVAIFDVPAAGSAPGETADGGLQLRSGAR